MPGAQPGLSAPTVVRNGRSPRAWPMRGWWDTTHWLLFRRSSRTPCRTAHPARARGTWLAAVILAAAALTGCGSSSSPADSTASRALGYAVTGCHTDQAVAALARRTGDSSGTVYDCAENVSVLVRPDGTALRMNTSDAPPNLTAAEIASKLASELVPNDGTTLTNVDCGSSTDVASGETLQCRFTFSSGRMTTFSATATGSAGNFNVELN